MDERSELEIHNPTGAQFVCDWFKAWHRGGLTRDRLAAYLHGAVIGIPGTTYLELELQGEYLFLQLLVVGDPGKTSTAAPPRPSEDSGQLPLPLPPVKGRLPPAPDDTGLQ